jgi:hypothetical protein
MDMDDREYMHQRYRERGGARSLPIWRERHGRMELGEADLVASSYGRHSQNYPDHPTARPPSRARRKNLIAAALLAAIGAIYLVFTGTSGSLFSRQPENGEFRVRTELQAEPTATLIFTASDKPVAMHLLDSEDREIFVAYIRAKRTAKLQVPPDRKSHSNHRISCRRKDIRNGPSYTRDLHSANIGARCQKPWKTRPCVK